MKKQAVAALGFILLGILLVGWPLRAAPQDQEQQNPPVAREIPGPGEHSGGTITAVGVERFTVKKQDGSLQTILVNAETRFHQGRDPLQLEDLKPGDRVMVVGNENQNKEFVARVVRRFTDQDMPPPPDAGEAAFGEIISVEGNQIKVRSRMQGERVIVTNDQTVFLKEGQTITRKDLKVGERIFAIGKETKGEFVATRVMTGRPRPGGGPFGPRTEANPDK